MACSLRNRCGIPTFMAIKQQTPKRIMHSREDHNTKPKQMSCFTAAAGWSVAKQEQGGGMAQQLSRASSLLPHGPVGGLRRGSADLRIATPPGTFNPQKY